MKLKKIYVCQLSAIILIYWLLLKAINYLRKKLHQGFECASQLLHLFLHLRTESYSQVFSCKVIKLLVLSEVKGVW